MKKLSSHRRSLTALLFLCTLLLSPASRGQLFTNLHSFTTFTTSDGGSPNGGMIMVSNVLYGTTPSGGSNYEGTVFRINPDGTGYSVIYNFSAATAPGGFGEGGGGIIVGGGAGGEGEGDLASTNADGYRPNGNLVAIGNTLYGTAQNGGTNGYGTVFSLHTDGSGFTAIHYFTPPSSAPTNADGMSPNAGLVLSGNTLYGTTRQGSTNGAGAVFAINTDGSGFAILHSFQVTTYNSTTFTFGSPDGSNPQTHLTLDPFGTLYGTTTYGGANGGGTLFSLNTNGTGFTDLHDFNSTVDGQFPNAVTVVSNQVYGTASGGGPNYAGTLFTMNTNGANFNVLQTFGYSSAGNSPYADLIFSSNVLYGAFNSDAVDYSGMVFAEYADGSGFTPLYTFSTKDFVSDANSDGSYPIGLLLTNGVLYGTAQGGGSSGNGTVFSLSSLPAPSPTLNLAENGTNVILSWTALATGFTLQSTTNLVPTVIWTAVSPSPVNLNGQLVVTNAISGPQTFYRLAN